MLQTIASDEVMIYLDEEIKKINAAQLDQGALELGDNESTLKKIQLLENYVGDDKASETSSRYQLVAKHILDAVDKALENNEEQNLLSVRYNVQKILETEGVRNRGYNTAVNTLTNVLDTSKMSYQNIENSKGARVCSKTAEFLCKCKIELINSESNILIAIFKSLTVVGFSVLSLIEHLAME